MTLTAKSIYSDTGNFFRNQFSSILLLALLYSFAAGLVIHLFFPSIDQMKLLQSIFVQSSTSESAQALVQTLTFEQQQLFLKTMSRLFFMLIINAIFINALFMGSILVLIQQTTNGQRISALQAIVASLPLLPRLLALNFIMIVSYAGFVFVIPGLLFTLLLAMAPVILLQDKKGVFAAISASGRLAWRNIGLITPALLPWLAVWLLLSFTPWSYDNKEILSFVISFIKNMSYTLLLIYLFRLYMLLHQVTS